MQVAVLAGFILLGATSGTAQFNPPFPATFGLDALLPDNGGDGSQGFVCRGFQTFGFGTGDGLWDAGDINNDGRPDLIISWPESDFGPRQRGQTYVVFGRDVAQVGPFPAEFPLASLQPSEGGDGSQGFIMNGVELGDTFGTLPRGDFDVNHDGIDDIIIGADQANPGGRRDAGQAYVVFGRDASVDPFPAEWSIADLLAANGGDGTIGFAINGVEPESGTSAPVAGAGDVNGDGVDDVVLGAYQTNFEVVGRSFIVFGRNTAMKGNFPPEIELSSFLAANGGDGSQGFAFIGDQPRRSAGEAVSGAGDLNNDGYDDVAIGYYTTTVNEMDDAGAVHVIFGRDASRNPFPAELVPGDLDGTIGFSLLGYQENLFVGFFVAPAGDVNHDGIDDLIIGAVEAFVVFGRSTFPATLDLSTLDGTDGFRIAGRGGNVSGGQDLNGDGVDDITANGRVIFGRDTAVQGDFPAVIDVSSLDGTNGLILHPAPKRTVIIRDQNADGLSDLAGGVIYFGTRQEPSDVAIVYGQQDCSIVDLAEPLGQITAEDVAAALLQTDDSTIWDFDASQTGDTLDLLASLRAMMRCIP